MPAFLITCDVVSLLPPAESGGSAAVLGSGDACRLPVTVPPAVPIRDGSGKFRALCNLSTRASDVRTVAASTGKQRQQPSSHIAERKCRSAVISCLRRFAADAACSSAVRCDARAGKYMLLSAGSSCSGHATRAHVLVANRQLRVELTAGKSAC